MNAKENIILNIVYDLLENEAPEKAKDLLFKMMHRSVRENDAEIEKVYAEEIAFNNSL